MYSGYYSKKKWMGKILNLRDLSDEIGALIGMVYGNSAMEDRL